MLYLGHSHLRVFHLIHIQGGLHVDKGLRNAMKLGMLGEVVVAGLQMQLTLSN